jgi:hypothetical protein
MDLLNIKWTTEPFRKLDPFPSSAEVKGDIYSVVSLRTS